MTVLDICLLQWTANNKRTFKILEDLEDKKFNVPIVPGGNSPSWIMGHLADTDDRLFELLGIGDRKYPELGTIYHHEKGSNQTGHLSKTELLKKWTHIVAELDKAFSSWSEAEWLGRHTAVSEEDFAQQPQRNRLNVMLGRVSHKTSHLGQLSMGG
ncbi:MAG: DinB family protein [Cyclobacteriaceae bacterium]